MFSKEKLAPVLRFIDTNFEFDERCSIDLRNYILAKGYATYYDDVLMLTPMGESIAGYVNPTSDEDEEDLTEGFYYMDHNGEDDYE